MNDTDQNQNGINTDEKELEQRIADLEDSWKRALADYKNLEKRTREEKEALALYTNQSLIKKLLPSLDHFEKVVEHCDDEGLKMVVKEFKQVLDSEGLTEIKALSQEFDPNLMEAVDTAEGEKNKVIEVLIKGYLLSDKLLRPARVKVGLGKKEE